MVHRAVVSGGFDHSRYMGSGGLDVSPTGGARCPSSLKIKCHFSPGALELRDDHTLRA
jgi:hypothetical protein